jgi:hypothetical protein
MGILGTSGMIFMRETFANVLLERKAALLRKKHNNPNYVSKFDTGLSSITLLKHAIVRPFIMLFMSPVVVILSTYTAIVFAYLFLLFTTFPKVFEEQYHWSGGVEGLAYIGIGVGLVSALIAFSFLSDWLLKKQAGDGPMKPEHRLPVMKWTVFLVPIGLFWYGWSAQAETFWLVPIMGTALIGAGAFCTFVSQLECILVVDLLTSFVDAYADLPRRLLWQICRLCPCRKYGIALNLRLYPSSR